MNRREILGLGARAMAVAAAGPLLVSEVRAATASRYEPSFALLDRYIEQYLIDMNAPGLTLALADASGRLVELPTAFDAFGPAAAADAPLPPGPAREHREALERALYAAGFRVNPKEWWHYSRLYGWRWPIAQQPRVAQPTRR